MLRHPGAPQLVVGFFHKSTQIFENRIFNQATALGRLSWRARQAVLYKSFIIRILGPVRQKKRDAAPFHSSATPPTATSTPSQRYKM
jgi:hypothetical protein